MAMAWPLVLEIEQERTDTAPGGSLSFTVDIRNTSDIVEHYGLDVLGLPDGATWRAEPDIVKLRPKDSGKIAVQVGLPEQPPPPAGRYVLGALVRSRHRRDVTRCAEVPMQLAPVPRLSLQTRPEERTAGRSTEYTVEVENHGNFPVRVYLTATDPERKVAVRFVPYSLELYPGDKAEAELRVWAPLPWSREKHRRLTIRATPDRRGAEPVSGHATFVQHPRFVSKFAKVAAIAAGVALLAVAIVVPKVSASPDQNAGPPPTAPPVTVSPKPSSTGPATPSTPPSTGPRSSPPPTTPPTTPPITTPTSDRGDGGGRPPVARNVDLTTPRGLEPDAFVPENAYRGDGFLVTGRPLAPSPATCGGATGAALLVDAGRRYLTSADPEGNLRGCQSVPLVIRFLQGAPAGAVEITPLNRNTLEMEVDYGDLTTSVQSDLTATSTAEQGGIVFVVIRARPPADGGAAPPVAVTGITISPFRP